MIYETRFIDRPTPPMGGKVYLIKEKGIFCLEKGPGTLITIAMTHAGSGSLHVLDGVPDERGFIEGEGFEFFRASPALMGSFMMNAGFQDGLTVKNIGGKAEVSPVATIVWMPYRKATPKA